MVLLVRLGAVAVQTVDVLSQGPLFSACNGRRLADDPCRDTTDTRLSGRPLALGRVVADVRRDMLTAQDRVDIAVHLHTFGQPDGVHFRHDAARGRAPLRPPLVERIRPAPATTAAPPSHFLSSLFSAQLGA